MNPIEQLCEKIKNSPEVLALRTVDCHWDAPTEGGVWFLDVLLDVGKPTSQHIVIEWQDHPRRHGFGMSNLTAETLPFSGAEAWVADEAGALQWVIRTCTPTK